MRYRPGQAVVAKCGTAGDAQYVISATFVRAASKSTLLLRECDGAEFEAKVEDVYPSMEMLEASIPGLRTSVNLDTGRRTEFPIDPSISHEAGITWHHRAAGTPSAFGARKVPDWMEIPPMLLDISPGELKRRVVRQFVHPSPSTGNPVTARELEGGIYCFETPGFGWQFTVSLERPKDGWIEVNGDAPPEEPGREEAPSATETVSVTMLSTAMAMPQDLVRPCIERSHQKFLANDRREVVSEYMGRTLIVVTWDDDGKCEQLVLGHPDIPSLNAEAQDYLRKRLAGRPDEQGLWTSWL